MSAPTVTLEIRFRWPWLALLASLFAAVDENEIAGWLLRLCVTSDVVVS